MKIALPDNFAVETEKVRIEIRGELFTLKDIPEQDGLILQSDESMEIRPIGSNYILIRYSDESKRWLDAGQGV